MDEVKETCMDQSLAKRRTKRKTTLKKIDYSDFDRNFAQSDEDGKDSHSVGSKSKNHKGKRSKRQDSSEEEKISNYSDDLSDLSEAESSVTHGSSSVLSFGNRKVKGKASASVSVPPRSEPASKGAMVYGHFVENDGRLRLKPGTSDTYLTKVQWARWQYEEACRRNTMRQEEQYEKVGNPANCSGSSGGKKKKTTKKGKWDLQSNFKESELTPKQYEGLLRMRQQRQVREVALWYRRELLLLRTAAALLEKLQEGDVDPNACVQLLAELKSIPFPAEMLKKNPWVVELIYQLCHHVDPELSASALQLYNTFRCLFSIPWGRQFMEVFLEQATTYQRILGTNSMHCRKRSRNKIEDRYDTLWQFGLYRSTSSSPDKAEEVSSGSKNAASCKAAKGEKLKAGANKVGPSEKSLSSPQAEDVQDRIGKVTKIDPQLVPDIVNEYPGGDKLDNGDETHTVPPTPVPESLAQKPEVIKEMQEVPQISQQMGMNDVITRENNDGREKTQVPKIMTSPSQIGITKGFVGQNTEPNVVPNIQYEELKESPNPSINEINEKGSCFTHEELVKDQIKETNANLFNDKSEAGFTIVSQADPKQDTCVPANQNPTGTELGQITISDEEVPSIGKANISPPTTDIFGVSDDLNVKKRSKASAKQAPVFPKENQHLTATDDFYNAMGSELKLKSQLQIEPESSKCVLSELTPQAYHMKSLNSTPSNDNNDNDKSSQIAEKQENQNNKYVSDDKSATHPDSTVSSNSAQFPDNNANVKSSPSAIQMANKTDIRAPNDISVTQRDISPTSHASCHVDDVTGVKPQTKRAVAILLKPAAKTTETDGIKSDNSSKTPVQDRDNFDAPDNCLPKAEYDDIALPPCLNHKTTSDGNKAYCKNNDSLTSFAAACVTPGTTYTSTEVGVNQSDLNDSTLAQTDLLDAPQTGTSGLSDISEQRQKFVLTNGSPTRINPATAKLPSTSNFTTEDIAETGATLTQTQTRTDTCSDQTDASSLPKASETYTSVLVGNSHNQLETKAKVLPNTSNISVINTAKESATHEDPAANRDQMINIQKENYASEDPQSSDSQNQTVCKPEHNLSDVSVKNMDVSSTTNIDFPTHSMPSTSNYINENELNQRSDTSTIPKENETTKDIPVNESLNQEGFKSEALLDEPGVYIDIDEETQRMLLTRLKPLRDGYFRSPTPSEASDSESDTEGVHAPEAQKSKQKSQATAKLEQESTCTEQHISSIDAIINDVIAESIKYEINEDENSSSPKSVGSFKSLKSQTSTRSSKGTKKGNKKTKAPVENLNNNAGGNNSIDNGRNPRSAVKIPRNVSRRNSNCSSSGSPKAEENAADKNKCAVKREFNLRIRLKEEKSDKNDGDEDKTTEQELQKCHKALRSIAAINFTKQMLQKKPKIVEKVRKFADFKDKSVRRLANGLIAKFDRILHTNNRGRKKNKLKKDDDTAASKRVIKIDPERTVQIDGMLFTEMKDSQEDSQNDDSNWWAGPDETSTSNQSNQNKDIQSVIKDEEKQDNILPDEIVEIDDTLTETRKDLSDDAKVIYTPDKHKSPVPGNIYRASHELSTEEPVITLPTQSDHMICRTATPESNGGVLPPTYQQVGATNNGKNIFNLHTRETFDQESREEILTVINNINGDCEQTDVDQTYPMNNVLRPKETNDLANQEKFQNGDGLLSDDFDSIDGEAILMQMEGVDEGLPDLLPDDLEKILGNAGSQSKRGTPTRCNLIAGVPKKNIPKSCNAEEGSVGSRLKQEVSVKIESDECNHPETTQARRTRRSDKHGRRLCVYELKELQGNDAHTTNTSRLRRHMSSATLCVYQVQNTIRRSQGGNGHKKATVQPLVDESIRDAKCRTKKLNDENLSKNSYGSNLSKNKTQSKGNSPSTSLELDESSIKKPRKLRSSMQQDMSQESKQSYVKEENITTDLDTSEKSKARRRSQSELLCLQTQQIMSGEPRTDVTSEARERMDENKGSRNMPGKKRARRRSQSELLCLETEELLIKDEKPDEDERTSRAGVRNQRTGRTLQDCSELAPAPSRRKSQRIPEASSNGRRKSQRILEASLNMAHKTPFGDPGKTESGEKRSIGTRSMNRMSTRSSSSSPVYVTCRETLSDNDTTDSYVAFPVTNHNIRSRRKRENCKAFSAPCTPINVQRLPKICRDDKRTSANIPDIKHNIQSPRRSKRKMSKSAPTTPVAAIRDSSTDTSDPEILPEINHKSQNIDKRNNRRRRRKKSACADDKQRMLPKRYDQYARTTDELPNETETSPHTDIVDFTSSYETKQTSAIDNCKIIGSIAMHDSKRKRKQRLRRNSAKVPEGIAQDEENNSLLTSDSDLITLKREKDTLVSNRTARTEFLNETDTTTELDTDSKIALKVSSKAQAKGNKEQSAQNSDSDVVLFNLPKKPHASLASRTARNTTLAETDVTNEFDTDSHLNVKTPTKRQRRRKHLIVATLRTHDSDEMKNKTNEECTELEIKKETDFETDAELRTVKQTPNREKHRKQKTSIMSPISLPANGAENARNAPKIATSTKLREKDKVYKTSTETDAEVHIVGQTPVELSVRSQEDDVRDEYEEQSLFNDVFSEPSSGQELQDAMETPKKKLRKSIKSVNSPKIATHANVIETQCDEKEVVLDLDNEANTGHYEEVCRGMEYPTKKQQKKNITTIRSPTCKSQANHTENKNENQIVVDLTKQKTTHCVFEIHKTRRQKRKSVSSSSITDIPSNKLNQRIEEEVIDHKDYNEVTELGTTNMPTTKGTSKKSRQKRRKMGIPLLVQDYHISEAVKKERIEEMIAHDNEAEKGIDIQNNAKTPLKRRKRVKSITSHLKEQTTEKSVNEMQDDHNADYGQTRQDVISTHETESAQRKQRGNRKQAVICKARNENIEIDANLAKAAKASAQKREIRTRKSTRSTTQIKGSDGVSESDSNVIISETRRSGRRCSKSAPNTPVPTSTISNSIKRKRVCKSVSNSPSISDSCDFMMQHSISHRTRKQSSSLNSTAKPRSDLVDYNVNRNQRRKSASAPCTPGGINSSKLPDFNTAEDTEKDQRSISLRYKRGLVSAPCTPEKTSRVPIETDGLGGRKLRLSTRR